MSEVISSNSISGQNGIEVFKPENTQAIVVDGNKLQKQIDECIKSVNIQEGTNIKVISEKEKWG